MASPDVKRELVSSLRQRRFLNKEFDSFRRDLLDYNRSFYGDKIVDLSEASLGGMLMDMPAYVGDVTSFYLDHQMSELDPDTAVEIDNIERGLKRAGVEIVGASPAVVRVSFFVEVPAATEGGTLRPSSVALPVVESGTVCRAENGIEFELTEDVDFGEVDSDGNLKAAYRIQDTTRAGLPSTFVLRRDGLCVSGFVTQESFTFSGFVPFRRITLSNVNVTDVLSVDDSAGNAYYRVGNLAEDVVFKILPNTGHDSDRVESVLRTMPAPFRYTTAVSLDERATTLIFGGGSASTLEDDAVPDPSVFALPLYGKTTFARTSLNPQRLLDTKTLGVSAPDVTVNVTYRYGGGLSHNVEASSIRNLRVLRMRFPNAAASSPLAAAVRGSVSVINEKAAVGGDDAPSVDDLKSLIPLARSAQSRIVTKPDITARAYTLPANFGRSFRVAVRASPNNPLASLLYVVCRDGDGRLTMASDALKDNLRLYLNSYRLISDSIDIVDARVVNYRLSYEITVDVSANKRIVLQAVFAKLKKFCDIKNYHIDQPLALSDLHNVIFNTPGVVSVNSVRVENVAGTVDGRDYSDVYHDIAAFTRRNVAVPPPGGIFEVKFPDEDILGRAL